VGLGGSAFNGPDQGQRPEKNYEQATEKGRFLGGFELGANAADAAVAEQAEKEIDGNRNIEIKVLHDLQVVAGVRGGSATSILL
jgi:hypothetical protein